MAHPTDSDTFYGKVAVLTLAQFLLRLSFGLTWSMVCVGLHRGEVTSGFFQKHLWVVMGMCVFAALCIFGMEGDRVAAWGAVAAAVLSYVGSVVYLYERPGAGRYFLTVVGGIAGGSSYLAWKATIVESHEESLLVLVDPITSGLLLGAMIAAMFLGHWYLNTPTMSIAPLQRLLAATSGAIALRVIHCGIGLAMMLSADEMLSTTEWTFLALRWLAGLLGAAVVVWMAWQTLKIPNTQSATGILYVGVIVTFLGELTSQLLSADVGYPL